MDVIVGRTAEVDPALLGRARALMDRAFDDYADTDWDHACGGHHVLVVDDGAVVSHASVVARRLWVGDEEVVAGYVESVATEPDRQGTGLGRTVMERIGDLVGEHHAGLAFLATGEHGFYERLGWQRWQGPTYVLEQRTEDEDDGIMVLTPDPTVDRTAALRCEPRAGDDW